MRVPPVPKWNPAVDGLDLQEFSERAREFERRWLPRDAIFPRAGQVWEAVRDCQVAFQACLANSAFLGAAGSTPPPFFPFGAAQLPLGEKVKILNVDGARPLRVSFLPLRYAELQEQLLPEHVRLLPGYQGYQLSAATARTFGLEKRADYFLDCFRLLEDAPEA